jgi:hypothetical protein
MCGGRNAHLSRVKECIWGIENLGAKRDEMLTLNLRSSVGVREGINMLRGRRTDVKTSGLSVQKTIWAR